MSMLNETYRFQREQSRAAKSRVLTSIRSRTDGPEKYLSLGALEVKTPTRKVTAFMGPGGSEYADFTATDRYVAPLRPTRWSLLFCRGRTTSAASHAPLQSSNENVSTLRIPTPLVRLTP
jgi:hypothetical protein